MTVFTTPAQNLKEILDNYVVQAQAVHEQYKQLPAGQEKKVKIREGIKAIRRSHQILHKSTLDRWCVRYKPTAISRPEAFFTFVKVPQNPIKVWVIDRPQDELAYYRFAETQTIRVAGDARHLGYILTYSAAIEGESEYIGKKVGRKVWLLTDVIDRLQEDKLYQVRMNPNNLSF